jgi:nitrite reductase/ring-hydroxylating ferredoxin subunit
MPLETFPDRFLDAERRHLVCSTHGARFAVTDGYCVSGPCRGAWLRQVAVEVLDGQIRLADGSP